MADNPANKRLAVVLGGAVALAILAFLATGGDLGGVKTVENDADLPKVTSPAPPRGADNTGMR